MCTFMYLFVVYFSFAPVISASIHRYVNYFDILMMVTETETSTSTLHHNIFTYLDYVSYASFILSDFNPYLLSYIYIYIYIYIYKYKKVKIYFLPMRLSLCGCITPTWEGVAPEVTVSSVGITRLQDTSD